MAAGNVDHNFKKNKKEKVLLEERKIMERSILFKQNGISNVYRLKRIKIKKEMKESKIRLDN